LREESGAVDWIGGVAVGRKEGLNDNGWGLGGREWRTKDIEIWEMDGRPKRLNFVNREPWDGYIGE
jgi:hypothetical protein